MNILKSVTEPLIWFTAILMVALAAGCGGSDSTTVTVDTTAPTVSSTVPLNAASGVAVNANITATFSEPMAASTITGTTFTLMQGASAVSGVVSLPSTTTATFNPNSDLTAGTTYTATITTGAKDVAGNALATAKVWTFTTVAAAGPVAIDLGTAGNFVILTKTGIGNTPTSAITGNIGVSTTTGASIIVTCAELVVGAGIGEMFTDDATPVDTCVSADKTAAGIAVADMGTAYTNASAPTTPAGVGPYLNLGGGTVTAQSLAPGVYTWDGAVNITGDLTLDGSATDVWIFQIAGTLDTDKSIILAGNAKAKNVLWRVADVVTLQGTSQFTGIILAQTNIAMITGATINGRLLAQTRVDLDQNTVTQPAP